MAKNKKKKTKNKYRQDLYYFNDIATSKDINDIAVKVFGSTYFTLPD
jgi:hypothetical protein